MEIEEIFRIDPHLEFFSLRFSFPFCKICIACVEVNDRVLIELNGNEHKSVTTLVGLENVGFLNSCM